MSNGDEYLLEELDREISLREEMKPDFSKCGISEEHARSMHAGTTILLKAERIRQRKAVHKDRGSIVIGGVKFTGWAAVGALAYIAFGKSHGWF